MTAISNFPTPTPSRSQSQTVFDAAVEAFLTHLPTFVLEANGVALAMNLNSTTATSSSSVLIGTGSKSFTIETAKSFLGGMYVVIADAAAPSTNLMVASVTSYDSGTGALVVNVEYVRGSGTLASWIISQSAPAANIAEQVHGATAKTTPVDADEVGIWDSVSGLLNRVTMANLRAWIFSTATGWYSSSYTPTITNGTNVASSTASSQSYYTRVGDWVTFDIPLTIDPTAVGEIALEISLPIASNFTAGTQATGVAMAIIGSVGALTGMQSAVISASVANDTLVLNGYAGDAGQKQWNIGGRYKIV